MIRPTFDTPLVPAFEILLGGRAVGIELAGQLAAITVEDDLDLPGMFTIDLAGANAGDAGHGLPWLDDEARVSPGSEIEIRLGYDDRTEPVIAGTIAAIEPEFTVGGPPRLRLRGYDARQRLQRGAHTRSFVDSTDSAIAEQIARAAGLRIDASDSRIRHAYVLQANQSDLAFLLARAERIGFELLLRDGRLVFRPSGHDAGEAVQLAVGTELIEFQASASVARQASAVAWQGWNAAAGQVQSAHAGRGAERTVMSGTSAAGWAERAFAGPAETHLADLPAAAQAEGDALAAARFERTGLSFVAAEGLTLGRTDLCPGAVVGVTGAGKRFSGPYYIHAVAHRYLPHGGFTTRFWARRNAL